MVAVRSQSVPVILDARVLCGSGGGPDKTIINSPRFLDAAGYRMLCAYMHHPNDSGFATLKAKAANRNVDLISIPDHGPLDWRVVPRMLDLCRRERVNVWHGHDYKTNALGLLLKRFWPMRLVTTVHGWVERTWKTPLYYLVDRLSLRCYEKVICVSGDLEQACRRAGVPSSRCELLENGIDLSDYRRTQTIQEAKQALGIPAHRILIGAVGRLSREKGFDLLIRAVDQLLRTCLDIELLIAGEGSEKEPLEKLIAELNLRERVRLLGYRPDLRSTYEAMDIFALSSLREGLPNVLLEALAVGVPVVATRINGVPRVIENDVNGSLVEAGSVDSLAGALQNLVADKACRERFSLAGPQTVAQQFSFGQRMDKLRRIYDALLANNANVKAA